MAEIRVSVLVVHHEYEISATEWYSRIARTCGASMPTLSPEFLWQLERERAAHDGGDRGGEP